MIKYNDSDVVNGLEEFDVKMQAALAVYCQTAAQKLETKAKLDRPWTDRSGDARKRLKGSSEVKKNEAKIVLAQGVDYGLWLELAHEKQYAVVEPTVRLTSHSIIGGLEHFLERLKS